MLVAACITVLFFAVFLASLMKLPNKPAYLVFIYLSGYAEIGLIAQVAHFVKQLNNPFFFVGMQVLLGLVVYGVWHKTGKPCLWGPFKDLRLLLTKQNIFKLITRWPDLTLLIIAVTASLVLTAIIIYVVPPNNNDSISTHASRIGFWLQHGSFAPWATPKMAQLIYPVNAQVQMLWTVLFSGSDRYVGFVQWLAQLAAMVSVFGVARLLKASRPQAAVAAFLFAALPSVHLQSTTTQNDLVAGALFGAVFYYFFLAIQENRKTLFGLSGLALGVGLATKQTIFFLLPGLGLSILIVWLIFKQVDFSQLMVFAASTLASFLLIGSVIFFINYREYQNPIGPESTVANSAQGLNNVSDHVVINSTRLIYQMIDTIGLPARFATIGIQLKASILGPLFAALNIPVESPRVVAPGHRFSLTMQHYLQEDEAWFGPIGFLILIPAMMIGLLVGIKRKEPMRITIFLIALGFLICDTLLRPGWDPYQGRYFTPIVIIAAPLLVGWLSPGWRRWVIGTSIMIVSIMVLYKTTFSNPAKPLRDMQHLYPPNPDIHIIWDIDRIDKITLQSGGMNAICRFVEKHIAQDATLALASPQSYYQEYCFFGENFTRRLVPVYPPERVEDRDWLRTENQVDYLLVRETKEYPAFIPEGFYEIGTKSKWVIYKWVGP